MNIVIFGSGSIGCYIAGLLHTAGHDPILIGRPSKLDHIAQNDRFTISDYEGHSLTVNSPKLSYEYKPLAEADLVIITTKCIDLDNITRILNEYCRDDIHLLCLQNGINSDSPLLKLSSIRNWTIIRGLVSFNVIIEASDESSTHTTNIKKTTEGNIFFDNESLNNEKIKDLFNKIKYGNSHFIGVNNFTPLQWAKLQLNLNNALNALTDLPLLVELKDRQCRLVLAAAMDELLEICKAKKLQLPKLTRIPANLIPFCLRLPNWIFLRLASSMLDIDPSARSSMWDDLNNGKKTEVDFLNGSVIREGAKYDIPTPVNELLLNHIRELESTPKNINKIRFDPIKFLKEIT